MNKTFTFGQILGDVQTFIEHGSRADVVELYQKIFGVEVKADDEFENFEVILEVENNDND